MKILAVADIHGYQFRLNIVLNHIEIDKPDLVVVCGDITQFGPASQAKHLLDQIPVATFMIPGNCDPPDVANVLRDCRVINIDRRRVEKNGVSFIGINSIDQSILQNKPVFIDKKNRKPLSDVLDATSILVSHIPPHGLQDRVFVGMHAGSKEVRSIVETYKPRLVLCGHIHEDPGITKFDNSIIVNCSMGKRTEGALIQINSTIDLNILD